MRLTGRRCLRSPSFVKNTQDKDKVCKLCPGLAVKASDRIPQGNADLQEQLDLPFVHWLASIQQPHSSAIPLIYNTRMLGSAFYRPVRLMSLYAWGASQGRIFCCKRLSNMHHRRCGNVYVGKAV